MDHFHYKDRVLHCDGVPVPQLAEAYGPVRVQSEDDVAPLTALQRAFAAVNR
jgi:hypothetical protein